MAYRDDLEAAHHRIVKLERELAAARREASPKPKKAEKPKTAPVMPGRLGRAARHWWNNTGTHIAGVFGVVAISMAVLGAGFVYLTLAISLGVRSSEDKLLQLAHRVPEAVRSFVVWGLPSGVTSFFLLRSMWRSWRRSA